MVNIVHKRQANDGVNWKCGVSCLEMIYDYFSIPYDANEIWENIKSPRSSNSFQMYALTYKLAQDSIKKGLAATIYKGNDVHILEEIENLQIPAILSIKQKKSNASHFVVFKGIKDHKYYFSDPDVEKEQSSMSYLELRDVWSPNAKINVAGFIFILFSKTIETSYECITCKSRFPVVYPNLTKHVHGVICPYCDHLMHTNLQLTD